MAFLGARILGAALFMLVLVLLLGGLDVHQTALLWQGPVWRWKPDSMVPVIGLKELLRIRGFSMRERRLLLSWEPGRSIIPGRSGRKLLSFSYL